jgi:CRP-like cAMP-binding protein
LPTQAFSYVNHLLADLPSKEFENLIAKSEQIKLTFGEVITERDDPINYVYFPTDSIISLVAPIEESRGMEVTMIGNEGMLGITLMLGVNDTPFSAQVRKDGTAIRIAAPEFLSLLEHSPVLKENLNSYLCVSFSQLVQAAICNRFHFVEERLARLLLMIRDRSHSQSFYITQDLLAHMLGVRRVGVTKAALALQHKNLIGYSRGYVVIHYIEGLEEEACTCYKTDKETYNRMLNKNQFELTAKSANN